MVAKLDEAEPLVAKMQLTKRMEVEVSDEIEKLVCVPRKIGGRIELHWYGLTDSGTLVELPKDCIRHSKLIDQPPANRV